MTRTASILLTAFLIVHGAHAQERPAKTVLDIEGTRFTIDGKPTFLLGISYYAGLAASTPQLRRDLDDFEANGINWLRVWANWAGYDHDVAAVGPDGKVRDEHLKQLVTLVAEADARGMIVDVTLTRDGGVSGGPARLQTVEQHTRAVLAIAKALKEHRNWYFDISNERNIGDKRHMSFDDVKEVIAALRKAHPKLIITASHGGDISEEEAAKYLNKAGVDFLAPHRPRSKDSPKETAAKTKELLAWSKAAGKVAPVHYQEPFRRAYDRDDYTVETFLMDLREARRAGAAGWCLHNGSNRNTKDGHPRRSFDLRGDERLLDRLDEVEREVVKRMKE